MTRSGGLRLAAASAVAPSGRRRPRSRGRQGDVQRAEQLAVVVDDEDAGHGAAACGRVRVMVRPPPGVSAAVEGAVHGLGEAAGDGQAEPEPGRRCGRRRRWNGAKIRSRSAAAMPGPWSTTRSCDPSAVGAAADRPAGRAGWPAARWRRGWRRPVRAGRGRPGQRQVVGDVDVDVATVPVVQQGRGDDLVERRPGAAWTLSAPACSRLSASRFSTRSVMRSADSSTVASSSACCSASQRQVGVAQAGDGGFDAGQRGAQVVADGGEQRGRAAGRSRPARAAWAACVGQPLRPAACGRRRRPGGAGDRGSAAKIAGPSPTSRRPAPARHGQRRRGRGSVRADRATTGSHRRGRLEQRDGRPCRRCRADVFQQAGQRAVRRPGRRDAGQQRRPRSPLRAAAARCRAARSTATADGGRDQRRRPPGR